jgi:hypothetical protein
MDLGSPFLAQGSQGQEVEHPLMAMLRLHDVLCDKLARQLRNAPPGLSPRPWSEPAAGSPGSSRRCRAA